MKTRNLRKILILGGVVGLLILLMLVWKPDETEFESATDKSSTTLEDIIDISELNTFEAIYNGIAIVMNEKKEDKVDFYVSYEAKVSVGFEFERLKVLKDDRAKKIIVTIPNMEITEVNVDIASLDYMFQNDKVDKSGVSDIALDACIKDVTQESSNEQAIYDLATQNAENVIEALMIPFLEEFDSEYTLEVVQEVID